MFNFVQTNGSSGFLKFMSNRDLGVFYDLVYNKFRGNVLFTCFLYKEHDIKRQCLKNCSCTVRTTNLIKGKFPPNV